MSKTTEQIKSVLAIVAMVSIPTLFVAVLFFDKEATETVAPQLEAPKPMDSDNPPERILTMEEAKEVEEGAPVDVPEPVDMEEGQAVAQAFVEAFHQFHADDPTGYLKAAEPFMTKRMSDYYADTPKRGAGGIFREEVLEMEVLPSHLEGDNQVWRIGTTGEAESESGTMYTFTEYQVLVILDGDQWKVDGVKANGQ